MMTPKVQRQRARMCTRFGHVPAARFVSSSGFLERIMYNGTPPLGVNAFSILAHHATHTVDVVEIPCTRCKTIIERRESAPMAFL